MAILEAFEYNGGVWINYSISGRTVNWKFYVRQYYVDDDHQQRWQNNTFNYYLEIDGTKELEQTDNGNYTGFSTKDFLIESGNTVISDGPAQTITIKIYCGIQNSGAGPTATNSTNIGISASQYTITYKPGSGSGSSTNKTKTYNINYTVISPDSLSFNAPNGQIFDYWLGSDGNHYNTGDTYSTNANLTLTAQWIASTGLVTLNSNGRGFAHGDHPLTVTHQYADNSGTKWAIRGTPWIENEVELGLFQGYYTTPTFENAEQVYTLYSYNGQYLQNTSVENYATVVLPNKLCFGSTTGNFENTDWKIKNSSEIPSPLEVPTWSASLEDSVTLYALWGVSRVNVTYVVYNNRSISDTVLTSVNNIITEFTIGENIDLNEYTPAGKRLVGLKRNGIIYQINDTYYLGEFFANGTASVTFEAQYEDIQNSVVLHPNGGYFTNKNINELSAAKTYRGGEITYNYRGQPHHPKNLTFLGYFDEEGNQVYEPYDNAYYSDETPKGAKAIGDGTYFSSTVTIVADSTADFADEVQFHTTTEEALTAHPWVYTGTDNPVTLYAHWKSATNAYIMDNNEWKSASVYVNTAAVGESPNWQPIDSTVFFDN